MDTDGIKQMQSCLFFGSTLYQLKKRMRQIHTAKPRLYLAFLIFNFECVNFELVLGVGSH
jgi:hypothetical protein